MERHSVGREYYTKDGIQEGLTIYKETKKRTKEFFEKIKSHDKTYMEYDGFLHELLNEKKRAQVFQDIFIFIEKHAFLTRDIRWKKGQKADKFPQNRCGPTW